jgi:hypothetical protein
MFVRKTELRTPLPDDAAPGDWWIEGIQPAPELPPFTTIAWLVSHMILGTWNWNDIIAGGSVAPEPALPSTADGAVALWNQVVSRFEQLVSDYSDDDLAEVDAWGGHGSRLVSHVIAEVLHRAEVGRPTVPKSTLFHVPARPQRRNPGTPRTWPGARPPCLPRART